MEFILLIASCLLIISIIVYPIVLYIIPRKDYFPSVNYSPKVSLIISAYNEEKTIEAKIQNSYKLDYPKDKIEIIIADDGSNDNTKKIVKSHSSIQYLDLERSGKTSAQNKSVQYATGEIIVFSDANSKYSSNAIKELIKWFNDPKIGCVCGELTYDKFSSEGLYWKYEKFIKKHEGKIGLLLGANGCIYAVRKTDYIILPEDAISDFTEPVLIYGNGKDVIYEPKALAVETTPNNTLNRKRRIILRTLQSIKYFKYLFNILNNRNILIPFMLHKWVRWFMPVLLIIILISNVLLVNSSVYYLTLLLVQLLFYLGGLLIRPIKYFILINYASLLALWDWFRGQKIIIWDVNRN